jgi:ABC-type sugar transport system substrate-binding protein
MTKKPIFTIACKVFFLISLFSPCLIHAKTFEIALFIPHEDPFWKKAIFFTRDAAADLGIKLQVYNADDDPDQMLGQVQKAAQRGIDGIIFPAFQNTGEKILQIAEGHQVPAILVNSGLPQEGLLPRTKYQYWIGGVLPNDEKAGTLLIQQLTNEARKRGIDQFHILAIEGNPKDESSIARVRGLGNYVKHLKQVESFKLLAGMWDRQKAYEQFKAYYELHPNVNIVWSANDDMALGVLEVIRELGLGRSIVVGGVDWDRKGLEAIEQGRMHVSVGGHFLDGAWAAILLYDYLNGVDFANEELLFESPMVAMTKNNAETLSPFLSLDRQSLDFGLFSKAKNPLLKLYTLDLHAIAAGLAKREKA